MISAFSNASPASHVDRLRFDSHVSLEALLTSHAARAGEPDRRADRWHHDCRSSARRASERRAAVPASLLRTRRDAFGCGRVRGLRRLMARSAPAFPPRKGSSPCGPVPVTHAPLRHLTAPRHTGGYAHRGRRSAVHYRSLPSTRGRVVMFFTAWADIRAACGLLARRRRSQLAARRGPKGHVSAPKYERAKG
jgi:hypothetical protein